MDSANSPKSQSLLASIIAECEARSVSELDEMKKEIDSVTSLADAVTWLTKNHSRTKQLSGAEKIRIMDYLNDKIISLKGMK